MFKVVNGIAYEQAPAAQSVCSVRHAQVEKL